MPPESDQATAVGDGRAASSPAAFSVHPERVDGVYRLAVSGELDLATRDTLRDELKLAEASDAKRILLDLQRPDVHRFERDRHPRRGASTLGDGRETASGSSLGDGQVREVLELTGLTEILDFTE